MQRPVVVLVEGDSDARVVELLTTGLGLEVVPMGGVTNIAAHVRRQATRSPAPYVLGLCDARERRFLERARPALDGIFVCDPDLEGELIAAVGPAAAVEAVTALGDLDRLRTFQGQPEWRDRPLADQLHRFAGTRSGRKALLAGALAERLVADRVPAPLADLVAHARRLLDGADRPA